MDGEVLGVLLFGVAGVLWLIIPFWDRKSEKGERGRFVTMVGLFVVVYVIIFTILGWLL